MTVSEQVRRYRTTGGAAIRELASGIRENHRLETVTPNQFKWNADCDLLFDEAIQRFRVACLWNMRPTRCEEGLRAIARHLKSYGGMSAWRHANRIEEFLNAFG